MKQSNAFSRPRLVQKAARDDEGAGGVLHKASHGELIWRADDSGEHPEGYITGYGSKFGLVDSYNETLKKGAFRASLAEWRKAKRPIPMLWQHMSSEPIGVWTTFKEDDVGLYMEGQLLLELPRAKEALVLIKAKAVTGLSIGYMEVDADPWYDPQREGPREVRKVNLRETSVVTFPALREAQLDAVKHRLAGGERLSLREFEALLRREMDLSRRDAEEIADLGYKQWVSREVGPEAVLDGMSEAARQLEEADAIVRSESPFKSLLA